MADQDEISWMDVKFFKELFQNEENENESSLVICDIQPAVSTGENYGSLLYRVTVQTCKPGEQDGDESKQFLIVKSLPRGEMLQKFLTEDGIFNKEIHTYEVIMPGADRLLQDNISGITFQPLAPSHFPTSRPYTLVLEDLKPLGFTMADRRSGLDLKHCTAALRALATLHATSVALHAADPSCMDIFQEKLYVEEKRDLMYQYNDLPFKNLASMAEKWPGYERFGEKIRSMNTVIVDRLIKVFSREWSLPVLNHGDFWVNNMMFRYPSSGDEVDIRLLDFQMCRFSSPALDIHYFFNTSLNDDVRQHDRELLLTVYQKELSDVLTALGHGSRALSLEQLQQEMRDTELFGLITACTVLCIIVADPSDAPNFDGLTEDNMMDVKDLMSKAYGGSRFRCIFQEWLVHYEEVGLL